MNLEDIVNRIYQKYRKNYPALKQFWEQFENHELITVLNKRVGCPLYSKNYSAFIKALNQIEIDEAFKIIQSLPNFSAHEKMELHCFLFNQSE